MNIISFKQFHLRLNRTKSCCTLTLDEKWQEGFYCASSRQFISGWRDVLREKIREHFPQCLTPALKKAYLYDPKGNENEINDTLKNTLT